MDINKNIKDAPKRVTYQFAKVIGSIGDQLYDLMQAQNVSEMQLAELSHLHVDDVNEVLGGCPHMTIKNVVTLFFALGHTLTLTPEPVPEDNPEG